MSASFHQHTAIKNKINEQVQEFNKSNINAVVTDLKAAFADIEQRFGISLDMGNVRYSNREFTTALTVTLHDASGQPVRKADLALQKYGSMLLGNKFDANKIYTVRGRQVRITGINPKARKYNVLFEFVDRPDGKIYRGVDSDFAAAIDQAAAA